MKLYFQTIVHQVYFQISQEECWAFEVFLFLRPLKDEIHYPAMELMSVEAVISPYWSRPRNLKDLGPVSLCTAELGKIAKQLVFGSHIGTLCTLPCDNDRIKKNSLLVKAKMFV